MRVMQITPDRTIFAAMLRYLWLIGFGLLILPALAQPDSSKLEFDTDFRWRVEQDWNGIRDDGSRYDDRTRFRFRLRFGMKYQYNEWASFGFRLRSGALDDQQGPHLTFGSGTGEFSLFQVGLEKAYFQAANEEITFWLGKNTFPFWKQNELFWNNNTYPDGGAFKLKKALESSILNEFEFNMGHFIIWSSGKMLWDDAYFNGLQLVFRHANKQFTWAPAIYNFRDIGDIPDRNFNYTQDYLIGQISAEWDFRKDIPLRVGAEYYTNLIDYAGHDSIPANFGDQTDGWVVNAKWGKTRKKGDWAVWLYYANLEKYSIVDYFAQNDWSRWDYSGYGSTGSKISNFRGLETRIIYTFGPKFNLTLRVYYTERLVPEGIANSRNSRARLDLNIKF